MIYYSRLRGTRLLSFVDPPHYFFLSRTSLTDFLTMTRRALSRLDEEEHRWGLLVTAFTLPVCLISRLSYMKFIIF